MTCRWPIGKRSAIGLLSGSGGSSTGRSHPSETLLRFESGE